MIWRYISRTVVVTFFLLLAVVGASFGIVRAQGGKMLSVQTGSMTPIIKKGDMVIVTRVPDSSLQVGDVVTYINPANHKQTITHRIIQSPSAQNQQRYVTKGDANKSSDPPIQASAIIGKVEHHLRYVGFGLDFMRKPIGLAILIYVPALSIIISEIKRLSKAYKDEQPYLAPGRELRPRKAHKLATMTKLTLVLVFTSVLFAVPVHALLKSNPVTLQGNTIMTKKLHHGGGNCDNNVDVTNTTNQNSTSGDANSNVGNANSGDSSNNNNTTITVTTTCH